MIEIAHLCKRFGSLTAVDELSLSVGPGEVLGFLGPNGAGKSTTMKVVTGYLRPTSGSVTVLGHDIETETLQAQSLIGYLPEGAPSYDEMTPRGFLEFVARVRGYDARTSQDRMARVVGLMSLEAVLDQRIETLSKGFKRRVGLAQALIHDPRVLILDEPTDGLDPNQKHQVRELIRGLSRDKIVIISTHILEEVAAVCTRAAIIAEGRLVSDCTPSELERQSRYHGAVTLRLSSTEIIDRVGDGLRTLTDVAEIEISSDLMAVTVFPSAGVDDLLHAVTDHARESNLTVAGIYREKGRMDEVFRRLTAGGAP